MPEALARQSGPSQGASFHQYWLAETLRLRESLWGPLEDAQALREARQRGVDFEDKVLLRARYLGRREKLDLVLLKWTRGSRLALALMALGALLGGWGAALGALGSGAQAVNLLLALAALLGLNLLALAFWALSFLVKADSGGSWLGESWLWLTKKLARGPDAALAPRALLEVLSRRQALRWLLGSVSHAWWSIASGSAVLTLLALLSARRYRFNWETTLLSPDAFVWLTEVLGWLPSRLGFAMPPEAVIRASDGLQAVPESAQVLWSTWLIGCLVVYGLLPRLVFFALGIVQTRRKLADMGIDPDLPGYAELRDRLSPHSERLGIDAPDTGVPAGRELGIVNPASIANEVVVVGIELPPEIAWPPPSLASHVIDLGVIDSRAQRKLLLDRLHQQGPAQLLMVCDERQTPDRGTMGLLADLASLAAAGHIALLSPDEHHSAHEARSLAWRKALTQAGFAPEHIHTGMSQALQWLAATPRDTSRGDADASA